MNEASNIGAVWLNAIDTIREKGKTHSSRAGETREVLGYSVTLVNPSCNFLTSRVRKLDPRYACAELLWYLSGTSDVQRLLPFAPSYSKFTNNGKAFGAYGARWAEDPGLMTSLRRLKQLRSHSEWADSTKQTHAFARLKSRSGQLGLIVELLREKPNTRQAVLTCWNGGDLLHSLVGDKNDIPCTLSLQFLSRDGHLHCVTTMRSNDVWLGLPYDIFCFTSIQRIIASAVGLKLGTYTHNVGSLHIYSKDLAKLDTTAPLVEWAPDNQYQDPGAKIIDDVQIALLFSNTFLETSYSNFTMIHDLDKTLLGDALLVVLSKTYPKLVDRVVNPQLRLGLEIKDDRH